MSDSLVESRLNASRRGELTSVAMAGSEDAFSGTPLSLLGSFSKKRHGLYIRRSAGSCLF
jgi:hypothetical protein